MLLARITTRPFLRGVAVLALADYAALGLAAALGRVPPGPAFGLVVAALLMWLFVLAWYPFLIPVLAMTAGRSGVRLGGFLEQTAIGMLAGLHGLWLLYVGTLLLRR